MAHSDRKEPLYRRVNSRTHRVWHGSGGEYRWSRHAKREDPTTRGSMHGGKRHGLDYTPLFRFLLSRVGDDWSEVHSEAVARLDDPGPIFWMVAGPGAERRPYFVSDENAFFSGLFVDDDNRLRLVDPDLGNENMTPSCPCCTHTFNGKPFLRRHPGWG